MQIPVKHAHNHVSRVIIIIPSLALNAYKEISFNLIKILVLMQANVL